MWRLLGSNKPLDVQLTAMLLSLPQLVLGLLGQPTLRRGVERNRQAKRHFRADARLAVENGTQRLAAGAQRLRRIRDRNAKRLQAELSQHFARVGRVVHAHDENLSDSPRS